MSLAEELLEAASILSREGSTQGCFRRTISTAYYALFHLLVGTACEFWPPSQRSKVARRFEHRRMKEASDSIIKDSKAEKDLQFVASAFVQLQEDRINADYDLSVTFSATQVAVTIASVERAFEAWTRIKDQDIAQGYLYQMLFKEKGL